MDEKTQELVERRDRHLKTIEGIIDGALYLTLNANDVFAWACAESCTFSTGEGFILLVEMVERWGNEGELAFMAECKQYEPQALGFDPNYRNPPIWDRAKYDEAREFVRGKPTGYCEWFDKDPTVPLEEKIKELEQENHTLRETIDSMRRHSELS